MAKVMDHPGAANRTNVQEMKRNAKVRWNLTRNWALYVMVLIPAGFTLVFNYGPMFGLVMAFQDFKPWLGVWNSPWVGFTHFEFMFSLPDSKQVIWNTLLISGLKLIAGLIAPFVFALFLNEIRQMLFKRVVQTMVYLPHFLSWVILGGVLKDILSSEGGAVNRILGWFGVDPIFFLGNGDWFRFTLIVSEVWKEFGFGAIVFLAALAGINPDMYEAAEMDGANRFQQTIHITIPEIIPVAVIIGVLSMNRLMDAGFDQIFNLYNPLVYEAGDIIDTYVYRMGILQGEYSFSTALGMFKGLIGLVLVVTAYKIANKYAGYRIF